MADDLERNLHKKVTLDCPLPDETLPLSLSQPAFSEKVVLKTGPHNTLVGAVLIAAVSLRQRIGSHGSDS